MTTNGTKTHAEMQAADHCPYCEQLVLRDNWARHMEQYHAEEWTPRRRAITPLTSAEAAELKAHEATIEKGLQTFYEVGTALLAIRDKKLYRIHHTTFEDYCRDKWQLKQARAYQLMDAAETVANLKSSTIVELPTNEAQARPLTELKPDEQKIVWEVVKQTAPAGKVTAAHVKSVANVFKEVVQTGALDNGEGESVKVADIVKAAVTEETYERMKRQEMHVREAIDRQNGAPASMRFSSLAVEWYTPARYIEAARALMGSIDVDPASCEVANQTVKAAVYYTLESNGLDKDWRGRIWLNPPYGKDGNESVAAQWVDRLIAQFQAGITTEAVLLINAVTERAWFHPLFAYPICFTNHRIQFESPDNSSDQPTYGNVFVYFGAQKLRFADCFSPFGTVVERIGHGSA